MFYLSSKVFKGLCQLIRVDPIGTQKGQHIQLDVRMKACRYFV